MAKGRVTIMVEPKTLREVDKLARALKRSRSEVFGMAMDAFLEDQKLGLEAFTNPLITEALMKSFGNREVMRALVDALGEKFDEAKFQQLQGLFSKLQQQPKVGK